MIIKQMFLPKGHPGRPGLPLSRPTSITIHWIGPYPKQKVEDPYNWWLKGPDGKGLQVSAHYIVKDGTVLQALPEAEVAWHCGGKGNYTSIGIEVIPMDTDGEFSQDSIETIRSLIHCINPKLPLKRHFDWTGKDCPAYYIDEARWKELKEQIYEPD